MIEILIGLVILAMLIGAEATISLIVIGLFLVLLFNFWYIIIPIALIGFYIKGSKTT